MISVFAINKNKYYTVNIENGKRDVYSKQEVTELCKRNVVYNLEYKNGSLQGVGYNIHNIPTNVINSRVYIAYVLVNNGKITGTIMIRSTGEVEKMSMEASYVVFRKCGIVNGSFINNNLKLKDKSYCIMDETPKCVEYKYDLEDYERLFRQYKEFGFCRYKQAVPRYSHKPVFGKYVIESMDSKSDFESFMESHILLTNIICKAEILAKQTIYKEIILGNGEIKLKGSIGLLLTYKFKGIDTETIIHKDDKKILCMVGGVPEIKSRYSKISSLFVYNSVSSVESVGTFEERNSNLNKSELNNLKKRIGTDVVCLKLNSGKYVSEDITLKIRGNIKINSAEIRNIFNKECEDV